MLTSPDILARQNEQGSPSEPTLRERFTAFLGLGTSRNPVLDVSRLSERMLQDLNLPEEFRPDKDPRGRL